MYDPYTEKKQFLETIAEEALMSDLLIKDFKLISLEMFKVLKETMSEEWKEVMKTISLNIENIKILKSKKRAKWRVWSWKI